MMFLMYNGLRLSWDGILEAMIRLLARGLLVTTFLRMLLVWCSTLLMGLIPQEANAFVLGELQLQSTLNQILQAKAPITLDPGEEIVSVDMGGNEDYLLLRLPRKTVVHGIQAQLKDLDGQSFIVLQSSEPIREKDFHLLLRVSSNHHTYFPFFRVRPLPAVGSQEKTVHQAASQSEMPEKGVPAVTTVQKGTTSKNRLYGPVRGREGLGDVARRFQKGTSFSVVQVEVAIWQLNQNRFIRNNMNGLKAGVKLVIPLPEEMAAVDKQEAKALRLRHAMEWKKSPKAQASLPPPTTTTRVTPLAAQEEEAQAVQSRPTLSKESVKEPVGALAKEPVKEPVGESVETLARESSGGLSKEPGSELAKEPLQEAIQRLDNRGGESDKEPIKVESGTLKAILVQLQVITRVLENHHERQEKLEQRVDVLEKNQEQQQLLENRVSVLERSMKEWNFLTKDRGADSGGSKNAGVPVSVVPEPKGNP